MFAAGQVVAEDLVCPEGGQDWVQANQVPALLPSAAPAAAAAPVTAAAAPAAASAPRLRMSAGSAAPASHAPAAATAPPVQAYPKATYPSQNQPGLMEKAAGAWGVLKIVGYGAVALIVVIVLIVGFITSQKEKKEIAKLHSLPGWQAFNSGNTRIDSEATTVGYGSTAEITAFAQKLAEGVEVLQDTNFPPPKRSTYRGRSKLGRIASVATAVTSTFGSPETYVEKHGTLIIALVHVPEFSRYSSSTRAQLGEACYALSHLMLAQALRVREELTTPPLAAGPPTNRSVRIPGRTGRPPGGATPSPPAATAVSPPKPSPEFTLVVGVRGKSDYEYVYVGKVSAKDGTKARAEDLAGPVPIKGNVPCHQELVKWFGEENAPSAKE